MCVCSVYGSLELSLWCAPASFLSCAHSLTYSVSHTSDIRIVTQGSMAWVTCVETFDQVRVAVCVAVCVAMTCVETFDQVRVAVCIAV